MINLLHQGQQAAQLSVGEPLAGKPVEVLARQVGNDPAFVFAEGHLAGDQQFEFFRVHGVSAVWGETLENTGILHEGQLTDHANNVHTDGSIYRN